MNSSPNDRHHAHRKATFLPALLCTSYDYDPFPTGTRKEEIAALLANTESTQNLQNKFDTILNLSAIHHERRHFYDLIGTTYGLWLFYFSQRILNVFLTDCLPHLQKLSAGSLPLSRWAKNDDCPSFVRAFVTEYETLNNNVAWMTGLVELPGAFSSEADISYYSPKGASLLPVIKFQSPNRFSPFGGYALEEGVAFLLENLLIRGKWGPEFEQLYNEQTLARPNGFEYLAAFSFFRGKTHSQDSNMFLAACDYALNVFETSDFRSNHPGWRFLLLVEQLEWKNTVSQLGAMMTAMERLTKNLQWPKLHEIWTRAAKYCKAQVAHNQEFYLRTKSVVGFVNLHYYTLALEVFEKRLAGTLHFHPFDAYMKSIAAFPRPPFGRRRVGSEWDFNYPQGKQSEHICWASWSLLWWSVKELIDGAGFINSCLQNHDDAFAFGCCQHPNCGENPAKSGCFYGSFLRDDLGLGSVDWNVLA